MKKKTKQIAKRTWNIYCNSKGEIWWDDGDSFWGTFTRTEANAWFREQLQVQLDEAKGKL